MIKVNNEIGPRRRWVLLVLTGLLLGGCVPPPTDGNGDGNGTGDGSASGTYDPAVGLTLQTDAVTLEVPPGAIAAATVLSVETATAADLPEPLPGGAGLAGGVFEPDGQALLAAAGVTVELEAATISPALPVVTFDEDRDRWVGTGTTAEVAGGTEATFELDHFSIAGVPDPVPIPDAGGEIGSFLVVSNDGAFTSDAISSDTAAMLFSDFGDSFNISVMSQSVNMQGQIVTKALGLDAILVTRVENYVIGVVGGGASLFNDGQFNEPAVGVMIMALNGSTVNVSVYVATPDRVISGSLSGPGA